MLDKRHSDARMGLPAILGKVGAGVLVCVLAAAALRAVVRWFGAHSFNVQRAVRGGDTKYARLLKRARIEAVRRLHTHVDFQLVHAEDVTTHFARVFYGADVRTHRVELQLRVASQLNETASGQDSSVQVLQVIDGDQITTLPEVHEEKVQLVVLKKGDGDKSDVVDEQSVVQASPTDDVKETLTLEFPNCEAAEQFSSLLSSQVRARAMASDRKELAWPSNANIFAVTLNTGNQNDPSADRLRHLVPRNNTANPYDLYVLGLQEVSKAAKWESIVEDLLTSAGFARCLVVFSWDRGLFLYARRSVIHAISELQSSDVFVGMGGVAGNKGAILCRFRFYETRYGFVNAHFAAHMENVEQRNADSISILNKFEHERRKLLSLAWVPHYWVLMGDLNYRIEKDAPECLQAIEQNDLPRLLEADQLCLMRRLGHALDTFSEAPITFAPTYKMERDVNEYTEEKNRVPSWCDRVLYRSVKGAHVEVRDYSSITEMFGSDHRPVYASFRTRQLHRLASTDLAFPFVDFARWLVFPSLSCVFRTLTRAKLLRANDDEVRSVESENSDEQASFPFVRITSDLFKGRLDYSLPPRSKTLCPAWDSHEIPECHLVDEKVQAGHVILEVWDKDTVGSTYRGRAVIYLDENFFTRPAAEDLQIDEPISLAGLNVGRMKGSVRLRQEGGRVLRRRGTLTAILGL
ncbi:Phosphatidylinositol 3,4,5-trisphosphate 5-phosphatase 1 [Porphyridium purpureum]|uniref:Phosphatidylinositol 3,4,5-trisphosphate 5-phosphatase 1 n=1 Tax=Porphyridium purpureum TaxID=35688 RepID=A0A5J4YK24_PORPP|nr:Phosphatidylinositol 3,4,5-trisphosphate 5-phosphatase 1 [Porphyridium purpureum]|eukprot:POR3383..scf244_11